MKSPIVPCLWLDDQAEAAARFYTATFPKSRIHATSHYPESADNPSQKPRGSVLAVDFTVAGQRFTAINGGPIFQMNPSISFFVHARTKQDAKRLFGILAKGGEVMMALDAYPWSECYGWTKDRFGVSWQVITGQRAKATIVPCLMFVGAVQGRAEAAMKRYTQIFPKGRIVRIERYAKGEGPKGSVKHGRFVIAGQEMVAMDSHYQHQFGFNEGISLQVMCDGQKEIDRYWKTLTAGGEEGPCGWLKDRFGLSWQVVPEDSIGWMTSKDTAARDRAWAAMMQMKKPDVAALEAAFKGPQVPRTKRAGAPRKASPGKRAS